MSEHHLRLPERVDVHVHIKLDEELGRPLFELARRILAQLQHQGTQMSQMDDNIAALQASVANLVTVDESAIMLIRGIGAQIQTAVDAALAQGATQAQLQALVDLKATIDAKDTDLAAAVAENTPTPPPAP